MVIARAPVRISFGGGGTDLAAYYTSFDGFVVSAAITRYCYVVASASADGGMRINSADYQCCERCAAGSVPQVQEPLILPKAVLEWFAQRDLLPDGVDLFLAAEVPPGTGLGSSSAMTVALIQALSAYAGLPLDARSIAALACTLEIERLDMPIGKQDQYASAYGGINTIDFSSGGVTVTPLGLAPDVSAALCSRLLLFSTGQRRDSRAILGQQRADTGSKRVVIDSLHRIKVLAYAMCEALVAEDLDRFGDLLDRAWREKRSLSGKISSASIDVWYAAARAAGALGGKITGAGGGGFLLLYCPPERQRQVRAAMAQCGLQELAFDFASDGAQVFEPVQQIRRRPVPASLRAVELAAADHQRGAS